MSNTSEVIVLILAYIIFAVIRFVVDREFNKDHHNFAATKINFKNICKAMLLM